ncbi:hypothetical protein BAE44_0021850 [Dichanthelium oligosanthes]|uniref:No apical meristem-associated C-terminal domain-containing protein n=1 Tax=Dichanthelium oligosanthes TaxID=888268 RepID=A0A1E5UW15_9POAL|nr:hypothetical protein BAE44_0021850 [Dichanthelium oligosanthes]
MGRESNKAAKSASSSQSGSQSTAEFTSLLLQMHVEKMSLFKAAEGEVATKIRKLVAIEEKKVTLKELREDREKTKEDERIMGIDLSSCNPPQCAMYESIQKEILAHWASRTENRRTSQ